MEQTLRPRRAFWFYFALNVFSFGSMLSLSILLGNASIRERGAFWHWIVAPASVALLGMAVWEFINHLKHRLDVGFAGVTKRLFLSTDEMAFANVQTAKWGCSPGGRLVLKSASGELTICFGDYNRDERLPMIKFLRGAIDIDKQQRWELFCLKVALPLRQPKTVAGPGEVLNTRRRVDALFALLLVPTISVALFLFHQQAEWHQLFGPPALISLFWIAMRISVPARGEIVQHVSWTGTDQGYPMWFVTFTFAGIGICSWVSQTSDGYPIANMLAVIGALAACIGFMIYGLVLTRRQELNDHKRAEFAALEWKSLDAAADHNR